jgi:hypothetical protein
MRPADAAKAGDAVTSIATVRVRIVAFVGFMFIY